MHYPNGKKTAAAKRASRSKRPTARSWLANASPRKESLGSPGWWEQEPKVWPFAGHMPFGLPEKVSLFQSAPPDKTSHRHRLNSRRSCQQRPEEKDISFSETKIPLIEIAGEGFALASWKFAQGYPSPEHGASKRRLH